MDNQRPEAIRGKSLHAMTTEQLEELLRREQDADREPDVDLIEEILAVLDDRTEAPEANVDAAWEDFKENYISGEPLYSLPDDAPAKPTPVRKKRWLRLGIVAAVLAAVVLGISVTASASGFNLWNVIVKWSSETLGLNFVKKDTSQIEWNPELYDLLFSVNQFDANTPLVPRYLPDGYKQTMLFENDPLILGQYENNTEKSIIIQYKKVYDNEGSKYQRDNTPTEVYTVAGIEHFISTNQDLYLALWANGDWECGISGVSSKQELLRMIDSIYSDYTEE